MNLYEAHNQWATRPADERFATLEEMLKATKRYADVAVEQETTPGDLQVALTVDSDEPMLYVGTGGVPMRLTNWAFTQLSQRAGAPADYLRSLPADMTVPLLNYGIMRRAVEMENKPVKLLVQSNGSRILRAITGTGYQRFWNWRVAAGLVQLRDVEGWRTPPARPATEGQPGSRVATELDVLASSWVRAGDIIAPAGLYASDHDMFAFMVNEEYSIIVPGTQTELSRGFFVEHSEVGDSAYKVWLFLYEKVCGNHIVWNAQNVREISIAHKGAALERIADNLAKGLGEYASSSAEADEAKLQRLSSVEIGRDKDAVIAALFGKRLLSQTIASRAYDACEQEQTPIDGSNPRTPWGVAQGLTRISQLSQYADQRSLLDRAAGKVLEAWSE